MCSDFNQICTEIRFRVTVWTVVRKVENSFLVFYWEWTRIQKHFSTKTKVSVKFRNGLWKIASQLIERVLYLSAIEKWFWIRGVFLIASEAVGYFNGCQLPRWAKDTCYILINLYILMSWIEVLTEIKLLPMRTNTQKHLSRSHTHPSAHKLWEINELICLIRQRFAETFPLTVAK